MIAEGPDDANVVLVCDAIVSHCLAEEVLDVSAASEGGRMMSKEYG